MQSAQKAVLNRKIKMMINKTKNMTEEAKEAPLRLYLEFSPSHGRRALSGKIVKFCDLII